LSSKAPSIPAIARAIIFATGWRRRLIAFAAGVTGTLAMAPFNFFPALIIPMTAAVWLIDGCVETRQKPAGVPVRLDLPVAAWRAFEVGWWWGFGYFVAGLWWLGAAFLVDADEFAWALPLGVAGLPAVLAVFPALGFMLARLIWTPGAGRLFALAAGLSFTEWLRGHVLTGFPWNTFGMALGGNLVTAQLASIVGLYGLTVIAILLFSAPAVLSDKSALGTNARQWLPMPIAAALLAFCGIFGFGAWRLAQPAPELVPGVKLRIMQPNVALKTFRPENKAQILAHYLALSARAADPGYSGLDDVTALIWPESAFPFILSRDARALAEIGAVLPQDTVLVTGAAREDWTPRLAGGSAKYFNAIQVVASGGHILESYDKVHLVPFGEYLPFRNVFDRLGLRQFVHVPGGFEAGSERRLLVVPGLPAAAPLICYEAIFPGEVVPSLPAAERPGLFLNVTDDGWYGMAGPYQHFAQARLRAIEEGVPLVRAANTGISAIVDPYGRVLAELPLGAEGVLDGGLPQSIEAPVFANFPFASAFLVWASVFSLAMAIRLRP
jgi:apolipoprotein N-acyltransferase